MLVVIPRCRFDDLGWLRFCWAWDRSWWWGFELGSGRRGGSVERGSRAVGRSQSVGRGWGVIVAVVGMVDQADYWWGSGRRSHLLLTLVSVMKFAVGVQVWVDVP